ncbi:MAG: right-handed parallel beta-helix repeat-containing protein, partial [Coriobacteriia bacterium]|nr:right-handed parallel beta-helix repeat-containing protein [Coriobacteriia bacterium]
NPYVLEEPGLIVPEGVTLAIEPGVIVKAESSVTSLTVEGVLVAAGTDASPVIFTSLTDDEGGDTNGDGAATQPAPGDWAGITIQDAASQSRLEYVVMRYGGTDAQPLLLVSDSSPAVSHAEVTEFTGDAGVVVRGSTAQPTISLSSITAGTTGVIYEEGAAGELSGSTLSGHEYDGIDIYDTCSPEIRQNDISSNGYDGIYFDGGASVAAVSDNVLADNGLYAIDVYDDAAPVLEGNSGSGNAYNAICLTGDRSENEEWLLKADGFPYLIDWYYSIGPDASVEFESGSVVKSDGGRLDISGALLASGSALDRVVFTSVNDDFHGGDTLDDGSQTSPSAEDGAAISVEPGGQLTMAHTDVLYGGGNVFQALACPT